MGLQEKSGAEIAALLDSFPEAMQRHPALLELRSRIARMRTDIGKPYVDIIGLTPEGDTLSLGEVIRSPECRYLLLDFGLCGADRAGRNFNLTELRENTARKGSRFGVSFDVPARAVARMYRNLPNGMAQVH